VYWIRYKSNGPQSLEHTTLKQHRFLLIEMLHLHVCYTFRLVFRPSSFMSTQITPPCKYDTPTYHNTTALSEHTTCTSYFVNWCVTEILPWSRICKPSSKEDFLKEYATLRPCRVNYNTPSDKKNLKRLLTTRTSV